MKLFFLSGIIATTLSIALSNQAIAQDRSPLKNELSASALFDDLKKAREEQVKSGDEGDYTLKTAELQLRFGTVQQRTLAVSRMWMEGKTEFLQLTWYRSKDRLTRCLICSLFVAGQISLLYDPADGKQTEFLSSCGRFTPDEAKERLEEFNLVRDNVLNLAKEWLTVLEGKVKPERLTDIRYAAALSQKELDNLRSEGWEGK